MLKPVVLIVFALSAFAAAAEAPRWSIGTAMQTRIEREVNPDYAQLKNMGQLFLQAHFTRWSFLVEAGEEGKRSETGALQIHAKSTHTNFWSRYGFETARRWRPYLGAGAGVYFDKVSTRWRSSVVDRSGTRFNGGLSAGVAALYWDSVLLEFEARAALVEDRVDPEFAGLMRLGVQL